MKFLIHLMLLRALPPPAHALATGPTPTTVAITVVDTAGLPVADAFVEASRHEPGNATGYTGPDGRVVLQVTREASLHVQVTKEGHYRTGGELWTGGMYKDASGKLVYREVPDSFEVILKKVVNPVEMVHVQYRGRLPHSVKPVGFDLELGDWVKPHGQGAVSDLLFYPRSPPQGSSSTYPLLDILFPNPADGIQPFMAARPFSMEFGSNLAPPHEAPLNGYQSVLSLEYRTPVPSSRAGQRINYILRTRTRTDAAGEIRQACYGWIQGEIEFDPRRPRAGEIAFTAHFNADPNPDQRSLESLIFVPQNR